MADELASPADPPECLTCGACCFSTLDRYLRVSGSDYALLGDDAETLVHFIGNRAYMRLSEGHCAALSVHASAARFVCSIYERRPATCRELARGSAECRAERAEKWHRRGRSSNG